MSGLEAYWVLLFYIWGGHHSQAKDVRVPEGCGAPLGLSWPILLGRSAQGTRALPLSRPPDEFLNSQLALVSLVESILLKTNNSRVRL